jgi:HK97 family phage portal protein
MGLFGSLFRSETFDTSPFSDFWYSPIGVDSAAGVRVTPDSAMRSEAVFSCVRVRSETLAALPLIVYRRLPDGGKERAPEHPLYRVLHDQPNNWQTSLEFREMMNSHLDLRGNAYAEIKSGPNGPVDQLVPIHPDRVQVKRYQDGSFDYTIRQLDGTTKKFLPDQVFHPRGWTLDGVVGLSPISVVREVVGIDLAAQDYAARFMRNDVSPSIVLHHPAKLSPEAYARLKASIQEKQTGENRHSAMILEESMKAEKLGMTNKDAQFLEARKYQKSGIASIFRVPPHMIGDLERATHSNIEHQGIEFTIYTMLPIAKRWEQRISLDLFYPMPGDDSEYFAEFLLDGLNRGDMDSRYTAYAIAINWGWMSPNDVRRLENMNPIDGGDVYLRPLNMTPSSRPGPDPSSPQQDEDEGAAGQNQFTSDEEEETASTLRMRLLAIAESASGRMARRESSALRRLAQKYRNGFANGDGRETFCREVQDFYKSHSRVVADSLHLPEAQAFAFCTVNAGQIMAAGRSGKWETVESKIIMNEGRARDLAQLAVSGAIQ